MSPILRNRLEHGSSVFLIWKHNMRDFYYPRSKWVLERLACVSLCKDGKCPKEAWGTLYSWWPRPSCHGMWIEMEVKTPSLPTDWAMESLRWAPGICAHPNKVVIYARTTKLERRSAGLSPGIPGDVGSCFENSNPELQFPSVWGIWEEIHF